MCVASVVKQIERMIREASDNVAPIRYKVGARRFEATEVPHDNVILLYRVDKKSQYIGRYKDNKHLDAFLRAVCVAEGVDSYETY